MDEFRQKVLNDFPEQLTGYILHPAVEDIRLDDTIAPDQRAARLVDLSAWKWVAARDYSEAAWHSVLQRQRIREPGSACP